MKLSTLFNLCLSLNQATKYRKIQGAVSDRTRFEGMVKRKIEDARFRTIIKLYSYYTSLKEQSQLNH